MSKQSESKERQGYREIPSNCGNCAHLNFKMELPRWMRDLNEDAIALGRREPYGENQAQQKMLRCGFGGFSVKKTASCNLWEQKQ